MNFFEFSTRILGGVRRRFFSFYIGFQFGSFGKGSRISRPLSITGLKNIYVGRGAFIRDFAWFMVLSDSNPAAEIRIGNGSYIGHNSHIVSIGSVSIEDKVMIADRVYISDNAHGYEDPLIPIIDQPLKPLSPVCIGEGSWIGENVCIIGANIGKHCVIGANSVVTKNIEDYCIAVGAPAKIIKRYDFDLGAWILEK